VLRIAKTGLRTFSKLAPLWTLLLAAVSLIAGPGQVTIAWDANAEPDVAGYNLYYGELNQPAQKLVVGQSTTVTLDNLEEGKSYYFYATAYNTAGLESAPSDQITYTAAASVPVNNPASPGPRVSAPVKTSGGGFTVTGSGSPGVVYMVQATGDLGAGPWTTLGSAAADAQGQIRVQDNAQDQPARFYRILRVN
jgi:hypothetical protein